MKLVDTEQEPKKVVKHVGVSNATLKPEPNVGGKVILYFSFILIIPIFFYIGKRNALIKLQMRINESASGIDVQLKKRKDTLIKLVDSVKGSMKFEKSLLSDITKLRTNKSGKASLPELDSKLGDISRAINVQMEAYPNLRSIEAVNRLIETAADIELEIAASRRLYNTYVRQFNQGIFTWPGTIAAAAMKLETLPLFEASAEDKKDVSIEF